MYLDARFGDGDLDLLLPGGGGGGEWLNEGGGERDLEDMVLDVVQRGPPTKQQKTSHAYATHGTS